MKSGVPKKTNSPPIYRVEAKYKSEESEENFEKFFLSSEGAWRAVRDLVCKAVGDEDTRLIRTPMESLIGLLLPLAECAGDSSECLRDVLVPVVNGWKKYEAPGGLVHISFRQEEVLP